MRTMANRLTQIATRTGDDGTTGLGDGTRVAKDHLRVQAMGDVDELNSQLGVLLAEQLPDDVRALLVAVQHELFNLGGELSIPGYELLKSDAVLRLDEALAQHNAALPRLKEFILPAGTRSAAIAHVGRTVARRAERAVVALTAVDGGARRAAPLPESPERLTVRTGPHAQPRQPRRSRRRRRLLEERAARPRNRLTAPCAFAPRGGPRSAPPAPPASDPSRCTHR